MASSIFIIPCHPPFLIKLDKVIYLYEYLAYIFSINLNSIDLSDNFDVHKSTKTRQHVQVFLHHKSLSILFPLQLQMRAGSQLSESWAEKRDKEDAKNYYIKSKNLGITFPKFQINVGTST